MAYFFLILAILHYVALLFTDLYAEFIAHLAGCASSGPYIICSYHRFEILPECMGIVSLALFLALLRYFRIPLRRWRPYVFGSAALLLFNVFRVYVLVRYTSGFFQFDLLHTAFWLVDPVVVVLYVWWLMR